jgi:hypothetical protein
MMLHAYREPAFTSETTTFRSINFREKLLSLGQKKIETTHFKDSKSDVLQSIYIYLPPPY